MVSNDHHSVIHDFPHLFRIYRDGRIDRLFHPPRVPPTTDPNTGVQSHDAVISINPLIEARIFIPKIHGHDDQKLPLLLYYHGGAFCIGSAFNITTQNFLTPIVYRSGAIAVALSYRLAPENPLPTAFNDSWTGFQWIASHSNGNGPESLLNKHADFGQVFLMGDSSGATIAQNMAIRASVTGLGGLNLRGLIAVHPFFTEKEPDELIKYIYPNSSGSDDDSIMNPKSDPDLWKMGCSRVLVFVAENDFLKPRGVAYHETLEKSEWDGSVEIEETEGEGHVFYVFQPESDKFAGMIGKMASFINQELD